MGNSSQLMRPFYQTTKFCQEISVLFRHYFEVGITGFVYPAGFGVGETCGDDQQPWATVGAKGYTVFSALNSPTISTITLNAFTTFL